MTPYQPLAVPTKKSVRRAGNVLAGRSRDMDEAAAMQLLSKWRAAHAYPINTLQAYLRGVLKRHKFVNFLVAQRLKRTPSIIGKLQRFEQMSLDRMQDIGGLRVIVNTIDDVYRLHKLICTSPRFKHQLDLPASDYIDVPKKDGYRSLHQVLRYKNDKHEELNGLRLEIQIRTRLQHSWATAVETLGMIQKSSIKTGGGDEQTKRFFKIVSALFALDERCNLPQELAAISKDELIGELQQIDDACRIRAQLEGVAVSAHHIETITRNYTGYHVIQLFIADQKVRLTAFSEAADAESFYKTKEIDNKDNPDVEILLMSAGALKDIKRAYPNYFLDTTAFLGELQRIASKES